MVQKVTAEEIFDALRNEFTFVGTEGYIKFNLRDFDIVVEQNNVVGNILEEWLAKWFTEKNFENIHNHKQCSPDFWLDKDNLNEGWMEVKSFTGSPNFDIGAFRGYINEIVENPWKLHAKYLLIKYRMEEEGGLVVIEDFWLKNVWEISCTSSNWPVKVQYRNKVINNIRPATWYSDNTDYPTFECLEDFLAALEQTIYDYHDTRSTIAENWAKKLCANYKKYYGKDLILPRWMDVKHKYPKKLTKAELKALAKKE
ncbi:MAG: NgoBV family restriction endonuclease [Paludibacteraceae bacterium]|nr:NgoBV family restriction endonuclease [Paludibacteraceae bacterium]